MFTTKSNVGLKLILSATKKGRKYWNNRTMLNSSGILPIFQGFHSSTSPPLQIAFRQFITSYRANRPRTRLERFQSILTAAAKLIFCQSKYSQTTQRLRDLSLSLRCTKRIRVQVVLNRFQGVARDGIRQHIESLHPGLHLRTTINVAIRVGGV